MRYFIDMAYCGGPYHGWQVQPGAETVQEVLEKALATLVRRGPVAVTGAGRTDAGCLLYTSPSPRDAHESRMPSSA